MICSYSLQLGNNIKQYNSYQALIEDVVNIKNQIEIGNLTDIVFSKQLEQDEVVALLKKINSNVNITAGEYNITSGELDFKASGHIAVSNYIDMAKKPDGSVFVTPYDENVLKAELLRYYVNDAHLSKEAAAAQINRDLKSWKSIAKTATDLHTVVRSYFAGMTDRESLYKAYGDLFTIEMIDKMLIGLDSLKDYIKKRHGDDVKIVSGLKINSDIVGEDLKLLANIDIVVVDNKSQAHIYQIQGSSKSYDMLLDVRTRKQDYKLAFYRHMLAAKGVPAKDMQLNIVPVRLIGLEEGELSDIIFQDVENRLLTSEKNGVNRLQWGSGEFYNNVNSKIEIKLSPDTLVNGRLKEETLEDLSKFFPGRNIKMLRHENTREEFIKHSVYHSDNLEKGTWMFYSLYSKEPIYIKESSDKTENAELFEKVDDYLKKAVKLSIDNIHNICNNLDSVLNGTTSIDKLVPKNKPFNRHALISTFSKYMNGDWEVVHNDQLELLGIVCFQNIVTKQVDIMSLSFHPSSLNSQFNLGLGSSILGCHKKDSETIIDPKILKATNGNIDLIKVITALNRMPDWFDGIFKIGKISVLDIDSGTTTQASIDEITRSFSELCKITNVANNLEKVDFATPIELFRQDLEAAYSKHFLNADMANNIFADLEKINAQNSNAALKTLDAIRIKLENSYPALMIDKQLKAAIMQNDEIALLYNQLLQTMAALRGDIFVQPNELFTISSPLSGNAVLGGTKVVNPTTIPDYNLRKIVEITNNAHNNMTQDILNEWEPFQNKTIAKLKEAKGYSWAQNALLGNQSSLYENMFETVTVNGKLQLNNMLVLKNPYDPNSALSPEERECLKKILWTINKYRFNLHNVKESDSKVEALKKDQRWFWLPLTEASTSSTLQQVNPKEYVQKEAKNIRQWLKKSWSREEENIYNETEQATQDEYRERYEIFNRFSISDTDKNGRLELLEEHSTDFWERNLETVVAKYIYAHIRKKHLDKALPIIKGIRLAGLVYGHQTNFDMEAFDKYIDDYLKSHIHNQSLLDKEMKSLLSYIGPVKYLGSVLALGFNVNQLAKNTIEGLWQIPGRMMTKFFAGKDIFNKEDYIKAVGLLISDSGDFVQRVTLIEALNQRFRIQDMDANRIAEKIISNKAGLLNAKDRLMFWCSTAPDYFNRMSMLLAQMIHDGSLDACSFTEEGFKYNWRRDRRFEAYANNRVGTEAYNKQRGLYLSLLMQANKEKGLNLKEGDDLPMPYTNDQMSALKTFSDTVFGFYDHDQRAMIERTALGSIFLQFQTYLTAARTTWLASPMGYNLGEYDQLIDEKTGKPMFLKTVQNEEGLEVTVPTTEDTGIPLYGPKYSYMEGIFYTIREGFRLWKTQGLSSAWAEIMSNDIRKNNMKLFAYNMFVLFILAGLFKQLFAIWSESREKPVTPTIGSVMRDQAFSTLQKSFLGSFQSFNVLESLKGVTIDAEPPAISILTNFASSTGNLLTGDKTLAQWFKINSGAYRSVSTFAEGIADLGKGVEGTYDQVSE